MKYGLKLRQPAFTLVESLLVLFLLTLLFSLAVQYRPQAPQQSVLTFEHSFAQLLQRARVTAQVQDQAVMLAFEPDALTALGVQVAYPAGYHLHQVTSVRVHRTGYIHPQTITWQAGQKELALIFQFGGGTHRFQQKS
ncbi:hypothetical protein PT274_03720 [Leuconostocaceae bacterium ESL0958]|nr:hypothetical protein [Leuconostocaceae bacterium ESL0958]